jgi:glycosyltransferase involved in cell wall biosynthesis
MVREAGAGVVVPPDDVESISAALDGLVKRWQAGALDGAPLEPALKERLSRRARTREIADLLESFA